MSADQDTKPRRTWLPARRPQRVSFRLSEQERIALDERVIREGTSEAEVIRAALMKHLGADA